MEFLRLWPADPIGDVTKLVTIRCAWCNRVRIEGDWLRCDDLEDEDVVAHVDLNHGICGDCVTRLGGAA
jgi:hypothetical protein